MAAARQADGRCFLRQLSTTPPALRARGELQLARSVAGADWTTFPPLPRLAPTSAGGRSVRGADAEI